MSYIDWVYGIDWLGVGYAHALTYIYLVCEARYVVPAVDSPYIFYISISFYSAYQNALEIMALYTIGWYL